MNSKLESIRTGVVAVLALILAGVGAQQIKGLGAERLQIDEPASTGSGFHGVREITAGLTWVGVYGDWRRKDTAAMTRGMEWVVRIDPAPLVYWLDGARMVGYDVAAWRAKEITNASDLTVMKHEQLHRALAWLERGRASHPGEALLPIEQAVLWWSVARDADQAERALAAAQDCENVPYFVARVRAEMLVKLGRDQEALDVLRAELPRLPGGDPMAMRSVVEGRIVALSTRLDL